MGEQAVQRKKAESGPDLGRRRCREENILCFFYTHFRQEGERSLWGGGESWVFCLFLRRLFYKLNFLFC